MNNKDKCSKNGHRWGKWWSWDLYESRECKRCGKSQNRKQEFIR